MEFMHVLDARKPVVFLSRRLSDIIVTSLTLLRREN
jgi:hypothetical protein